MKNEGIYYLGRLNKLGQLNNQTIIDALRNPTSIYTRGNNWTIIGFQDYKSFYFGFLEKYISEGEIITIDTKKHSEIVNKQRNLYIARSPFIYIPKYSGLAFLKVSSHIEPHIFAKRFCDIIIETFDDFFVDCSIEMITDLRTFSLKLSKLDFINRIYSNIKPPNPLFSPIWNPLKKYLIERNLEKMKIDESSKKNEALKTELPLIINILSNGGNLEEIDVDKIAIGDASILMAADGYGIGTIKGQQNNKIITIKTSETIRNFSYKKIPIPEQIYEIVADIFEKIEKERYMEHE